MEIIISDTNKKRKLLINKKRELLIRKHILKELNLIKGIKNVQIISPITKYEKGINEILNRHYPILFDINIKNINLIDLIEVLHLENENFIVLPFFKCDSWFKLEIDDIFIFLENMYKNKYFYSLTLCLIKSKRILDIELGETTYEIRIKQL